MSSIKKLSLATTGVAMLLTAVNLSISGRPAIAFTVTQDNNANNLLTTLLGSNSGLSDFTTIVEGNSAAFGLFTDATDPFGIDQGVVLSTGKVVNIPGVNTKDGSTAVGSDLSTSFGLTGSTAGKTYDPAKLDISFKTDSTVDKLFFQYVFGSEEFKEYGGGSFNDSFKLLLNGVNLAKLTNGDAVTVNNLVSKPSGPFSPDYINNPAAPSTQTKLDGFTKVLTFEGALKKNDTNTLSIQIEDVSDGILDSAVFIKGGSIGTEPPPAVPEPSSVLSTLAFGAFYAAWMRKRQLQKKKLANPNQSVV